MSLPKHPQVIIGRGELRAHVDVGLADLLLALWDLRIATEFSCQNFGTRRRPTETGTCYGYIAFTHFADAVRFVDESRRVFLDYQMEPGVLSLETSGERAFVDFPAYKLLALTSYWRLQATAHRVKGNPRNDCAARALCETFDVNMGCGSDICPRSV